MSEENKARSRRVLEGVFQGNPDVVDELLSPDFVLHDPSGETGELGAHDIKGSIEWLRSAFPDARLTIDDQVAEGEKVTTRYTFRGVHRGALMGEAPTGKEVTFTGHATDYFSGGKIVESWANWDTLGLMRQVGAVPPPE
jgi:predicted ester cyclase